ncbi:phosphotriesterase-related protein [soil metagenome]
MAIQTVLGPVEPGQLGMVLPHEHLVIGFDRLWRPPRRPGDLRMALGPFQAELRGTVNHDPNLVLDAVGNPSAHLLVGELAKFADAGGSTLVEVTPIGMGRAPEVLAALSRLSGVNVVMSTSLYIEQFHPPFVDVVDAETIAALFVEELTVGVDGTGIRAGYIGEIGTISPLTENEFKVLDAAVLASAETGVAINVHRTSYPDGDAVIQAIEHLLGRGASPDRVVVSHCDEVPDMGLTLELARRGVYVEFDTFGMEAWAVTWPGEHGEIPASTDSDRIRMLLQLLEGGFREQLLLSQDVCNKAQLCRFGGYGYAHLIENIFDRLRRHGLSQQDLDQLSVSNPARVLTPA